MSGDHRNYSIVEIGQNTEKSPGDLKRIPVTQNPVFGNKRMSGDHRNDNIAEIGQTPEKSPGDFKRFVVTRTPMKDHQQTLL